MNKRVCNFISLLMLIIIAGSLFANLKMESRAAQSDEISGTIEVMSNVDKAVMQEYIDGFEKKYPKVTVKYHCLSDYENEIKKMMDKGNYGDVLLVPSFEDSSTIARDFEPLGDYTELSEKYKYLESCYRIDETLYSIPSSAYLTGIVYNKDVFYQAGIAELPKTSEAFMEALSMIAQRTNAVPFCTNYALDWSFYNWCNFPYIEMTGDADYKSNRFIYEENPFMQGSNHYRVYKLLYDIVAQGLCEEELSGYSWDNVISRLGKGEIGCMVMGSWSLKQIKSVARDSGSIGFMPFPNQIDGKQYMTICTDYGYGISTKSQNKKVARAYIDYMLDESGYAIAQEKLSIVKTDPCPDVYGDMGDVVFLESNAYIGDNYEKYVTLSSNLNMEDNSEIKRIVAAAAGIGEENFDDIMLDWNERWEKSRPADMITFERRNNEAQQDVNGESVPVEAMRDYELMFSQTESDYIKNVKSLKIGYIREMAPFQYELSEEDGDKQVFAGLASHICEILEKSTGLDVEYVGFQNSQEIIQALERGEIDIAAGIEKSNAYAGSVKFSKSYADYMNVMLRGDTVDSASIGEGRYAQIAGEENRIAISATMESIPVASLSELVKEVETRQADYAITNYYSAEYYIRSEECSHIVVVPMTGNAELCFAFDKDVDTRLISICNKCIYSVPKQALQVMLMQYMDPPAKKITLMRFVEDNPLFSFLVCFVVMLLLLGAYFLVQHEKNKSAKKHAIDMKRYEILSQLMDEYVFEYNFETDILHFDKKFDGVFQFGGDIHLSDYTYGHSELDQIVENCNLAKKQESFTSEAFELIDKSGKRQWYRMTIYKIQGEKGGEESLLGKLLNVQQEMEQQQLIRERAQKDVLTGLLNRESFQKHFEHMYRQYGDTAKVTFVILDMDNFKEVNDSLGHAGGDAALKLLADRLSAMPENIVVARYSGDDFLIGIFGMEKQEVENFCAGLVKDMDREISYQAVSHHISISLGAVFTNQKLSYEMLFAETDKVLYYVKAHGKNAYRVVNHMEEV